MNTAVPTWLRATSNILNLMRQIGEPLSGAQEIALHGALAIWFEKAKAEAVSGSNAEVMQN